MGHLLNGLAAVLDIVLQLLTLLVIASWIVSMVGADPHNPIVAAIRSTTEPMYRPFRKLASKLPGPLDWAPMMLLLVIVFVQRGIVPLLRMGGG